MSFAVVLMFYMKSICVKPNKQVLDVHCEVKSLELLSNVG